MDSSLNYWGVGGLNAFDWRQIFAQNILLLKYKKCIALMEAQNYCKPSSQRNNLTKLIHYHETKTIAHDS